MFNPQPKPEPTPKKEAKPFNRAKMVKRVCKICKDKYEKRSGDLITKWCSFDCKIKFAMKAAEKKRKEIEKEKRKKTRQERERLKSLPVLHKELRTLLQKLARLIDQDLPCICTGKYHDNYDGGHFWAAGSSANLQHNMHNIHKCSVLSNQWRSGDENRYRKGLISRYGQEYFDMVDSLHSKYPILKMSREKIYESKEIAKDMIKEFPDNPVNRYQANKRLNIYN